MIQPIDPLGEKVKTAIQRLQTFVPKDGNGYYLAFSGGKDSVVCKALLDMAGVPYHAVYRVTSVDPPELVRFIKEKHPDVKMEIPHDKDGKPITMWNLIPKRRMPPTQLARYCCQYLKEDAGDGSMTVTGVRWAESVNRQHNQGLVTIHGKAAAKEIGEDENFAKTQRGGNTDQRQCGKQAYSRVLLQEAQDNA